MILQKIFLKLKSPEIADSWFMHTSVVQHAVKICLKMYNCIAPKLPLCRRVNGGYLGTGNQIHPTAIIDYDHVVIGDFCIIEKNVVIDKNSIIGNYVIIREGAVIGSEGFEFRRIAGEIVPVVHLGGIIIGDNAVIGPRVCIDKSVLGEYTEVGASADIRSEVQIGHGIKIGCSTTILDGTMVGGYAKIGNQVTIGRHCSIADGLNLVDGAVIPDSAIITRDMKNTAGNREDS